MSKMITLDDVKKDPQVRAYIKRADENLVETAALALLDFGPLLVTLRRID